MSVGFEGDGIREEEGDSKGSFNKETTLHAKQLGGGFFPTLSLPVMTPWGQVSLAGLFRCPKPNVLPQSCTLQGHLQFGA